MTDKKKVIKGLECIIWEVDHNSMWLPGDDDIRDAIALLKEQEAVVPIPYHRSDGTIFKYECRQCRTKIFKMDLFCRHCGRQVKWE